MTCANNLDPDEAPYNVGPHPRSKFFCLSHRFINIMDENKYFLHILEENSKCLLHYKVFSVEIVKEHFWTKLVSPCLQCSGKGKDNIKTICVAFVSACICSYMF